MFAAHVLSVLVLFSTVASAQPTLLPFTTIARGDHSAIEEPRELVVRTAAEWSALWKRHAGDAKAPAVDFARAMVIAVFAGSRPTAGYNVEITRVEKQADAVVVIYRERRPTPDEMVAQVLTAPFHIVQTSPESGPVRFQKAR